MLLINDAQSGHIPRLYPMVVVNVAQSDLPSPIRSLRNVVKSEVSFLHVLIKKGGIRRV